MMIYNKNTKIFKNRSEAGKKLTEKLNKYKDEDILILALPRGGVPVAEEVSKVLNAPLSVLVSRKVGAPGHEEFGIGAVSEENTLYMDEASMKSLNLEIADLQSAIEEERTELKRRVEKYRSNKPLPSIDGKTVILVDDGLATGVTAKAALKTLQGKNQKKLILAVPVCSGQSTNKFKNTVDELVCLTAPSDMRAIGYYYEDFSQTTDEEVVDILKNAN